MAPEKNKLYYGDNYEVLQQHITDESVDLIYLDPPFNSRQDYNVLFAEKDGSQSSSQIRAFEDTWEWNIDAERSYEHIVERGGRVADAMRAFRTFLHGSDMMAYLAMMAPRLVELRRVLKETGSIYLHCDPTASHYLKILMDAVFGPENFRNELIWKRTSAHVNPKRWGPVHDNLLFYSKTASFNWNRVLQNYDDAHLTAKYRDEDARGRYTLSDLTGAGRRGGDSGLSWRDHDPDARGRHWAVPKDEVIALVGQTHFEQMSTQQKLETLAENGFIYFAERGRNGQAGFPRFKRYIEGGMPIQDVIADISPINSQAQERLGYPTQKPEALLERIIGASSNEGDVVLDPFCGCGTTIQVAQRLNRRWIGIDITHLAIGLIKKRLSDSFGDDIRRTYSVIGEPTDHAGAAQLAEEDKYQFQWWALGLVGARPVEQKKGADRGVDGRLYFHDDASGKSKQILFSVKAGGVSVTQIRDLRGTLEREKAEIGVFLCFEQPTKPMEREAVEAGFYQSSDGSRYPRIQIFTIEELLAGKQVQYPAHRRDQTFKRAPRHREAPAQNLQLPLGGDS